jgi:serine/threonine-protein kinase
LPPHPPTKLGRYELRAKIADGGMAAVYVARRDDGEVIAVKMIREEFARNKEFLMMLLDEAKIALLLRHPNIVRYDELGGQSPPDGAAFIAMELLFGQSLWNVWEACRARGVRLRYDMIAWIGARVADALHYAHELTEGDRPLGIVHRDVNATNIFVTYDGEIKVIDFGLAKAANRASKTAAGIIKGKVAYMSPEQAVGAPVDRRTDVFALGTTLWELACDRRLFKHGDEVETLKRVHVADVPDPTLLVDGFPPGLWTILRRALARDREERYGSAHELARALDEFAGTTVSAAVVAQVMHELFAEDRARQAAWVHEASGPESRGVVGPLKARSRFWTSEEDVPPSASLDVAPPPGFAPPAVAPSGSRARGELGARGLVLALVALAVFVVVFVIAAAVWR